ncbi:Low-density lipoprotein receptor-related protein 1 [Orchesella cincta]|uniref:Low-density lipoprotein receptor-related protein 1 n=1 Tax=Orchesella cincta TaxID=48709 RepID=A0A1D2N6I6_ORCCI|nr:Low-density lipoprotein receptor-related protein 1 [Orchesella cincta]
MKFIISLIGLCAVFGLVYSHYTPERSQACSETEFTCQDSGRCLPASWICDGDFDCGEDDMTDEQNCVPTTPAECTEFVCPNGRCISSAWICDNENDCDDDGDGSDEVNCPEMSSTPCSGFVCPNGACIPQQWTCDGDNDCGDEDFTDEKEEACPCADNETRCPQPSDSETPGACKNRSDEANCTATFNVNEPHYRPETVEARKLQRKMKKNRKQVLEKSNKKH